jgi:hypothetical protein
MKKCISNKRAYQSHELAVEALIEARTRFEYGPSSGPVAVYKCDDCGYYHLTSQGPMEPRLEKLFRDGNISLQKEADRWLDKLKKR